jgi:hypothetical protein
MARDGTSHLAKGRDSRGWESRFESLMPVELQLQDSKTIGI